MRYVFIKRVWQALMLFCLSLMATRNYAAENIYQAKIDKIVNDTVQPLIQEYNIPSMAVLSPWMIIIIFTTMVSCQKKQLHL